MDTANHSFFSHEHPTHFLKVRIQINIVKKDFYLSVVGNNVQFQLHLISYEQMKCTLELYSIGVKFSTTITKAQLEKQH